jgi:hypothetical protein
MPLGRRLAPQCGVLRSARHMRLLLRWGPSESRSHSTIPTKARLSQAGSWARPAVPEKTRNLIGHGIANARLLGFECPRKRLDSFAVCREVCSATFWSASSCRPAERVARVSKLRVVERSTRPIEVAGRVHNQSSLVGRPRGASGAARTAAHPPDRLWPLARHVATAVGGRRNARLPVADWSLSMAPARLDAAADDARDDRWPLG